MNFLGNVRTGCFWLCVMGALACADQVGRAQAPSSAKLPPPADRTVDYVNDVQPILAKHCDACHGEQKQKADLRLDDRAIVLRGGESGAPAIIPGKSADSPLIQRVAGLNPDEIMPPKGERLSADQIGLLRAWIDQGAQWPAATAGSSKAKHWAFVPPVKPEPPLVTGEPWVRTPIDNFILARLQKEGLKPSSEADRITLVRRASLDLIGLPPTPDEVDQFVNDTASGAYDRMIERLLASPHYGERWGRHWLDLARYADSNGYEKDARRSIWPYRDYVIKAFNRDLPFDQFTIEQLAGDLLPNPTLDQRVATGYLRNSMMNQEGGIEPEQFRTEAMIDRMDAVGKTWLGLTIACAQCHNHKFDPLTTKEYYQLFAFLNNDDEPSIEVPSADQTRQRNEIRAKIRQMELDLMDHTPELRARMAAWEHELADAEGDWTVLQPTEWINFATKFEKQRDGSLLGGGDVKPGGVTHFWVETPLTNITGFRLEVMQHPNLPYNGPGLVGKGSFLLREFTVEAYAVNDPKVTNVIKFVRAIADMEAPGFSITNAIDGNIEKGGWTAATVPVRRNSEHRAVFECAQPIPSFPGGTRLHITVQQKHSNGDGHSGEPDSETKLDCHLFGRFRISATTRPGTLKVDPLTPEERRWLAISPSERTVEQQRSLFNVWRFTEPSLAATNQEIDKVWATWPYVPTTLALQQRAEPRTTRTFKRGDWQRLGDEVQSAVPAFLHPLPSGATSNRLGFAQWLVDRRSPTTARVVMNRLWQAYFGQGLFTTPEDIGTRVDAPSHQELLDWLACEFMDRGWSFKEMHRLITHSATYRQSSRMSPELYERDAYNRLLARGPRFRVEGEIVQDIALSVSGLLNSKIGGPSVYPPIPGSVADQVYGGFSWPESKGDDRYRRAMYTFWKRALPFPTLLAFDTPPAENSCPRRVRSNTPLQALTTLNEKSFVEAAQAMGLRVFKEGGADERSRMTFAFRLCTGRRPSDKELDSLLKFWAEQDEYFANRTAAAVKVSVPDLNKMPEDVNLHKVAAWAMVSRALLNLDETVTRE